MEIPDPLGRELEGGAIGGLEALGGGGEVLTRDLEGFGLLRRPAIEPLAVIPQRGVAFRRHPRADLGDSRPLFCELR